jgi:hypothetical protein
MPCLTFATVGEAEAFLTDVLGEPDVLTNPVTRRWSVDDSSDDFYKQMEHFFIDCCDGNSDIWAFEVREVQHGKPIISFDLD